MIELGNEMVKTSKRKTLLAIFLSAPVYCLISARFCCISARTRWLTIWTTLPISPLAPPPTANNLCIYIPAILAEWIGGNGLAHQSKKRFLLGI